MENGPFFTDEVLLNPNTFPKITNFVATVARLKIITSAQRWELGEHLDQFDTYYDSNEFWNQMVDDVPEDPMVLLMDAKPPRERKRETAKKVKRYSLVHKRKLVKSSIKRTDAKDKSNRLENARRPRPHKG